MGFVRFSLIAAALMLRVGVAQADAPPGEGIAEALFEQAREEMRRGAYAEACLKFAESERIDPSHGTLLNLVLCEEKLGKVASAWLHAKQLFDRLPADDPRKAIVERRLAALAKRVPKLSVSLAPGSPPASEVLLDGVSLGASSLGMPLPVDPGVHRIVVKAPAHDDGTTEVTVVEGQAYDRVVEPGPARAPAPPSALPPAPPPAKVSASAQKQRSTPTRIRAATPGDSAAIPRWVGWTSSGVGVAALAVGGVLGAMVLDRVAEIESKCPSKVCPNEEVKVEAEAVAAEGKRLERGLFVASAVGVVGVGFGVVVLTLGDPREPAVAGSVLSYGGTF